MPDREGHRLGNYRLTRLLGQGAFAEVYLGEHLYLNNYAAIKLLLRRLSEQEEVLFLSEAQTLARLAHPHIVQVRDFALDHGAPFLAMEYAPAGTLRQRHSKGSCLPLDLTVSSVKQIASALQYAHNHGIIHRDVKPENVLVGPQHLLLSDFGISLHLPSLATASSQGWAGTLPYIAPEQLQGQAVYASDQYALAIMAYEWLCGRRPFEGPALGLVSQHLQTPPPPLREHDPSLPEAVERVILKALSKDPGDRYMSVLTFARVLERASQQSQPEQIHLSRTDAPEAPAHVLSRRVFLAHANTDEVAALTSELHARDIAVLDLNESSTSSEPGEEALRQAVRAAQVVLLVISPHTRSSPEVQEHLRISKLYRRPLLGLWRAGEALDQLLPAGAALSELIDARGQRERQALEEILKWLERERLGGSVVEHLPTPPAFEPRNPYKGLHAFTQHDRGDFFGREGVILELLSLLREQVRPSSSGPLERRLLTIVGPSGSGKSSVVMAGLLPKLREGALPGSDAWIYPDPLVPGHHPLDTLAQTLAACFPDKEVHSVRELLNRDDGLHQIALAMGRQQRRVVLLIDQFEELFSPGVSEDERQRFLNLLVIAATMPRGPVLAILTLRADLYDRPLAYPALARLLQHNQYAVLPMELEELREVIERPALLPDVRLVFEQDLVGDLLYEIRTQAGALPLLEFTLSQLFAHRRGHYLTRQAYQEIGGVRGALTKHAEDTYVRLPSEEHRTLARWLFARLIQPEEVQHELLRRRAPLAELTPEEGKQAELVEETIAAFLAARLLTTSTIGETTMVEVSHEALLHAWPRVVGWTNGAREDMQLQQSLSHDVAEWEQRDRPKDRLYRGTRLKESLSWSERNLASRTEGAFLRASTSRRKRERLSLLLLGCLLLALLFPAGLLVQQTLTPPTVTTLQDSGPGSLRQAVGTARPGSTIYFAAGLKGHIPLKTKMEIAIDNLTIRGPGSNVLSIGGVSDSFMSISIHPRIHVTISGLTFSEPKPMLGVFFVNNGSLTLDGCQITNITSIGNKLPNQKNAVSATAVGNLGTLTIRNSSITRNKIIADVANGGAIVNEKGTVTISNSQITDNTIQASGQAAFGGAITSANGKLTLINSTISGNKITGGAQGAIGGGIDSEHDTLILEGSSIINNTVSISHRTGSVGGGGIDAIDSTIMITKSRITNNTLAAHKDVFGAGMAINGGSLTLTESAVLNNSARTDNGIAAGGGIQSSNSTIKLNNSQVANNSLTSKVQAFGGGIGGSKGSIVLNNSTVASNTISAAEIIGGGIAVGDKTPLTLTNTTVSNNAARGSQGYNFGGGIFEEGTLTVTNSIISNNTLTSIDTNKDRTAGGGISVLGTLNLSSSTVSGNTVKNSNGFSNDAGILVKSSGSKGAKDTLTLTNCTIANNRASGRGGNGGGIEAAGVSGTIDFCTIYGNTAPTFGGGFVTGQDVVTGPATITFKNTLIANNSAAKGPDIAGDITTGGYNLVQHFVGADWHDPAHKHMTDYSGDTFANLGIDPQLHAQGQATPTLALQSTSPALNRIPAGSCDVPADQRGMKRPQQGACDIGAYEYTL